MALSPKMFLHNIGGRFGPHGDPLATALIRHPIFGPTLFGGTFEQLPQAWPEFVDMYVDKSLSAVTKVQALEDQFAVEGSFDNPPSEVLEAVNAEFATFAASYNGMSGSSEIRRGYSRSIVDGVLSSAPVIDSLATRFFDETHDGFGADYIAASPDASYWAVQYGVDSIPAAGIPATRISKYNPYSSFTQSKHTAGTVVDLYSIDTGISMGTDPPTTYQLQFEGSIGDEDSFVEVRWHKQALYLAQHGVWIKPFSILAQRTTSSTLVSIQDAGYLSIMAGPDSETLAAAEQAEYDQFALDNPTVVDTAEPHGIIRYLYTAPVLATTYTDVTPTATISGHAFHTDFLPVEVM